MVTTRQHTIQDLWNLGSATERYELIEGELIEVSPTSFEHGEIQLAVGAFVRHFVNQHKLGKVVIETGFVLSRDLDTVLGPDIAFVSIERLPADPQRFSTVAPDLAIEIVSPGDRQTDIDRKVRIYLDGGVRTVWIVNPANRRVIVYEPGENPVMLAKDESLDGGAILPGFSLSLTSIFDT